jgi:hypothetical protein
MNANQKKDRYLGAIGKFQSLNPGETADTADVHGWPDCFILFFFRVIRVICGFLPLRLCGEILL